MASCDILRHKKLIDLGTETLANALLELTVHSDRADDLVERHIATPNENIQRFKKKLSALHQSNQFIDWKESSGFACELEDLLQDLKQGVTDPLAGVELIIDFYKADKGIIENCDDSSGCIGDVFCFDAKKLFVEYASRCAEKEKVANIIMETVQKDDYGVRGTLIDCAGDCLPEPIIRKMIKGFQKQADQEENEYVQRHYLIFIESLARQIKDAKLFEQTRIASCGKLSTTAIVDIARVYLESGDVQAAHSLLNKIPADESYQTYEREKLLLEIYRRQGDEKKLGELLFKKFRSHHSTESLQELLDVIGNDKRNEVVSKELIYISEFPNLVELDAEFLISIGKIDEAEEYLFLRADKLNGGYYSSLLSLAETMELEGRNLVTSLIYRSLLNSILQRGYTKAYPHGVNYLNTLDRLSVTITSWNNFISHKEFKEQIYQKHGRKRSFWSKYGDIK